MISEKKMYQAYSFYAVYSLSIDKDTILPYLGFSYLSSETEIDFFFYLGLSNMNDENS